MRILFVSAIVLLSVFSFQTQAETEATVSEKAASTSVDEAKANEAKADEQKVSESSESSAKTEEAKSVQEQSAAKETTPPASDSANSSSTPPKAKNGGSSLPELDIKETIANPAAAASCLKPGYWFKLPEKKGDGWSASILITHETFPLVMNKDGAGLAKLLIKDEDCDPAIRESLIELFIDAPKKIDDKQLQKLADLKVSELTSKAEFLREYDLYDKYAKRMDVQNEKRRPECGFAIVYENGVLTFSVEEDYAALQSRIALAKKIHSKMKAMSKNLKTDLGMVVECARDKVNQIYGLTEEDNILQSWVDASKNVSTENTSLDKLQSTNSRTANNELSAVKKRTKISDLTLEAAIERAKNEIARLTEVQNDAQKTIVRENWIAGFEGMDSKNQTSKVNSLISTNKKSITNLTPKTKDTNPTKAEVDKGLTTVELAYEKADMSIDEVNALFNNLAEKEDSSSATNDDKKTEESPQE